MNDRDTIQVLRNIVVEMGLDNVCQNPHAFAGAILDMCDVDDVKLLTTVLRSHYSTKLMDWFRNGGNDAATWMQQKTFLINESGMSVENAESVLGMLWQAMNWQQPKKVERNNTFDQIQKNIPNPGQPKYGIQPIDNDSNMSNGAGYGIEQRPAPMPIGGMIALSIVLIFCTFFICGIPGIVALVKTLNINEAMTYAEQQARYADAKKFGIISLICVIIVVLYIIVSSIAENGVI